MEIIVLSEDCRDVQCRLNKFRHVGVPGCDNPSDCTRWAVENIRRGPFESGFKRICEEVNYQSCKWNENGVCTMDDPLFCIKYRPATMDDPYSAFMLHHVMDRLVYIEKMLEKIWRNT
jgi:hypothetical protein